MADNYLNTEGIAQQCLDAIKNKINNLSHLNIIVAGKTGVGKSTLINAMFRENLAATGIGRPVTEHMSKIEKTGFPLSIYDTRGFELGKDAQKQVREEIIKVIKTGAQSANIDDKIHCIWYCINSTSNRIEDEEIEWLKAFAKENTLTQVPVIIVLTQSISRKQAEEMKRYIIERGTNVSQIVPVLAMDYPINDEITIKAYGLDTLLVIMSAVLPEELQDTLQNVQKASLASKIKRAHQIVATAAAAAVGEGVVPVPFADAALLVPTQITMIAGITAVFGIDVNKSFVTAFISSALGTSGATVAGRTIVTNVVKFIPYVGSAAGAAISGTTAGIITTALGETYILLMAAIYKGEIKMNELTSDKTKAFIEKTFHTNLKKGGDAVHDGSDITDPEQIAYNFIQEGQETNGTQKTGN